MHILEMHIIEWMSTYNAGLGLMSEQGTEALHAHFKQVVCMAVWQSAVAKMHHARASSECVSYSTLNALKPEIRTIKRNRED